MLRYVALLKPTEILSIICIHGSVFLVWGPYLWGVLATTILFVYHLFLINAFVALYQCVTTNPGHVPQNWGFYLGDETKRRRFCKICNIWKPDRTHHCSICKRCVLNMDHHCPWFGNCIGFYNRKFFIQLWLYVFAVLCVFVLSGLVPLIFRFIKLATSEAELVSFFGFATIFIAISWCLSLFSIGVLFNFIRFHLRLVLQNYTTIENLEKKDGAKSKFDIGSRRNWEQVFGANSWLWWCPWHSQASRPIGDGIRWRVSYTRAILLPDDEDAQMAATGLQSPLGA